MPYPPGYLEERTQVLEAISKAIEMRAAVVALLSDADSEDAALTSLQRLLGTTELGARAVLELQFRRLVPAERRKIEDQLKSLRAEVSGSPLKP
ncbi:hypothetical protein JNUCC0626_04115 [Lentzea sp. JNUCC 0626]|uniref:hypothetical protein n=1 Tax=Lentzea sp. JNUCC 0626 TaxID=3367513 RepID=UPI0037492B6F